MTQSLLAPTENTPYKLTFEEFLAWVDEDTRAEWVDGEVQLRMPVSLAHQLLVGFLTTLLNLFITKHQQGCILSAPFLMRLPKRPSGREPDILYVAPENVSRLRTNFLEGAADMVIEIVSPESRDRDYEDKRREYEQDGVKEYWLIDLPLQKALFHVLNESGHYEETLKTDGEWESLLRPGFRLDVNWLWRDPLPLLDAIQTLQLLS